MAQIEEFKRNILLLYHIRPKYIMNRMIEASSNYKIFINYSKYGLRLLKKNLFKKNYISPTSLTNNQAHFDKGKIA